MRIRVFCTHIYSFLLSPPFFPFAIFNSPFQPLYTTSTTSKCKLLPNRCVGSTGNPLENEIISIKCTSTLCVNRVAHRLHNGPIFAFNYYLPRQTMLTPSFFHVLYTMYISMNLPIIPSFS